MDQIDSSRVSRVPIVFGGRWIAWNHERSKIVADGKTFTEAREAARQVGEMRPFLTKVPDSDVRFVGGMQ